MQPRVHPGAPQLPGQGPAARFTDVRGPAQGHTIRKPPGQTHCLPSDPGPTHTRVHAQIYTHEYTHRHRHTQTTHTYTCRHTHTDMCTHMHNTHAEALSGMPDCECESAGVIEGHSLEAGEGVQAALRATRRAGDGGPAAPGPRHQAQRARCEGLSQRKGSRGGQRPRGVPAGVASLGLGSLLHNPGDPPFLVSVGAGSWGAFKFWTPELDHPSQAAWKCN